MTFEPQFDWMHNGKRYFGIINEVLIHTPKLIIARYYTPIMLGNDGKKMMNPLIQFKPTKNGHWNCYFLDSEFEEYDFPIFETKGCRAYFDYDSFEGVA